MSYSNFKWSIIYKNIKSYHLTCLLRNLYGGQEATVRIRHEIIDWFKIGKGVRQGCILPSAYLTYMQSTSCEMLGWMKHKLESRLLVEISTTSDMQYYHSNGRKWRGTKDLLMTVKEKSEKAGLKLNIQKTKSMANSHIISWQIDGVKSGNSDRFYFLGLQNYCGWWLKPRN